MFGLFLSVLVNLHDIKLIISIVFNIHSSYIKASQVRRKRRNIKKTIFEKVTCKLCRVIYATSPYICEPSSKHLLLFALPVSLQEFQTAQTENIISNHI